MAFSKESKEHKAKAPQSAPLEEGGAAAEPEPAIPDCWQTSSFLGPESESSEGAASAARPSKRSRFG